MSCEGITVLLVKDVMKPVPPADMKAGYFSPYIIVPKKSGGLRPILALRILNWAFHKPPFKMLTQKCIFGCFHPRDRSAAVDRKNLYFRVSIFPRHRSVLRFAFEGRTYKYKVLPFRLSLSPRVFTKVVEAALVPLREQGVRILNYLDDWLILAQSQDQDQSTKGLGALAPQLVGPSGQLGKEKTLPDAEDLFSRYGVGFGQSERASRRKRTQLVLNCLNTFKNRTAAPLKQFQRLLGHMAAAVTPLGLLHMRPLQHWLHGQVPRWAWESGTLWVQVTPACRQTFTPWSDLSFLRFTRMPPPRAGGPRSTGLQFRGVWTGPQLHWHINCLELLAVHLALNRLKRRLRGEHVLVCTDSTATVAYINRQGGQHSRRNSPVTSSSGVGSI